MKKIFKQIVILLMVLSLYGCNLYEVEPKKIDLLAQTNEIVKVEEGQSFQVEIESNPTTGYQWFFDKVEGIKLLKKLYEPKSKNLLGSDGLETFTFVANNKGKFEIRFYKKRSWEKSHVMEDILHLEVY